MQEFHYQERYAALLTPEIVNLLIRIHELRIMAENKLSEKALSRLAAAALLENAKVLKKLANLKISSVRLKKVVEKKVLPKSQAEIEIASFCAALKRLCEKQNDLKLSPSLILQLHHALFPQFSQTLPEPPSAVAEAALEKICIEFLETPKLDKLLIIPLFLLDFLGLNLFEEGRARLSFLLLLFLTAQAGYEAVKYISLEKAEANYENGLAALNASTSACGDRPFVEYFLNLLLKVYEEFWGRLPLKTQAQSKIERIKEVFRNTPGKITKRQLQNQLPDLSLVTIGRLLKKLSAQNLVALTSRGRLASYYWKGKKEN